MDNPRPSLKTTISCRRDLVVSLCSSAVLTMAIFGSLALVTMTISNVWESSDLPMEPITMQAAESVESPEEITEDASFQAPPSPSIPVAPKAINVSIARPPIPVPMAAVPVVDLPPPMDDLAWADESFEPWMEEKKPVAKPVVAKKSSPPPPTPQKKSVVKTAPKRASVKPVSARVVSRSTPSYPSSARRSGKEGRVVVTVTLSASGKVISAHVSSSSSHSILDSAALSAAKRFRFTPARNSRGEPVSSKVALPFTFKLT